MKTEQNFKNQFLPEVGFSILDIEIDVENLLANDALRYWELCRDHLLTISTSKDEYEYYFDLKPCYTEPTWDERVYLTFDIYDDLPSMLDRIQDHYPTMTQIAIIQKLEHHENLLADSYSETF